MKTTLDMPHHGNSVKRIREMLGIKQDTLATTLGLSQQAVSQMEQKERLDAPVLEKVSKALGVSEEVIKNFSEEAAVFHIQNMHDNSQAIYQYNFNPIDKLIEAHDEIKRLYECLLQAEKDKNALLQQLLDKK